MATDAKSDARKLRRDARRARRQAKAERIDRARKMASDLPSALDAPFCEALRARWATEPTLAAAISQLCTATQFEEPDFVRLREMYRFRPRLHRKQWELIYILRAIELVGGLAAGCRGLGFGVGREKLTSLLAAHDVQVVATDLPADSGDGHWAGGPQHAASLEATHRPELVSMETFRKNVQFRPVNMRAIPDDLTGFDYCWSACALEHLGGLEAGFDFIRASLECLRPGGLAVHTTEFNLGSESETLTAGGTVVYREKDITAFAKRLTDEGHRIELNLCPGATPTDRMIDQFREGDIHIRLYVRNWIPATSIGLSVIKGG